MKNLLNAKKWVGIAATILLSVFFLASCTKNDNSYNQPPVAGFMAFNLAPDQSSVGFLLSGNSLTNFGLAYTNYTGNYLPVYTGTREVAAVNYLNGNVLATATQAFADSSFYSGFLVGANGRHRNIIVEDNFDAVTPVTGKAWVRYVNAIADTVAQPTVTIGDHSSAAAFGSVSGFEQVAAGDVAVAVADAANFNASRNIAVEENKIYTILLVGQPGSTDPNLQVQIKFIQNGSASN